MIYFKKKKFVPCKGHENWLSSWCVVISKYYHVHWRFSLFTKNWNTWESVVKKIPLFLYQTRRLMLMLSMSICNLICGVPRVGWSSKGRTVDSKPGTRVDGYSHHEQEKLVLQVSKKEGLASRKRNGIIGRGKQRERLTQSCIHEYLFCVSLCVICE